MNTKEIFASNLRVKKEELKLTQDELAVLLKRKKPTVAAWLEGRSAPRLAELPDVMKVFKIRNIKQFLTKKIA